MPIIQEFALDATGTRRIQIFQDPDGEKLTILHDNSIIGFVPHYEALATGLEFSLKGKYKSLIKVQSLNNQLQVLRHGRPLLTLTELTKQQEDSVKQQAALAWQEMVGPKPAMECQICKKTTARGTEYRFYFGNLSYIKEERLSYGTKKTYEFRVAGTQGVFLCNRCVVKHAWREGAQVLLWTCIVPVLLIVGTFVAANYFGNSQTQGLGALDFVSSLALVIGFPIACFKFISQPYAPSGDFPNPKVTEYAENIAIKLRKKDLQAQGYSHFSTRLKYQKKRV